MYIRKCVRTHAARAPAKAAADPAITALIPHRSGIAKQRTGTDHRAVCDDTHWPQSCVREVCARTCVRNCFLGRSVGSNSRSDPVCGQSGVLNGLSQILRPTRKIIGGLVLAVVICRDINNRYVPPSLGLCARAKVSARARPVSRAKDSTRPL